MEQLKIIITNIIAKKNPKQITHSVHKEITLYSIYNTVSSRFSSIIFLPAYQTTVLSSTILTSVSYIIMMVYG